MKTSSILVSLTFIIFFARGQENKFIAAAQDLITQRQYAGAHTMLDSAISRLGPKPSLVALMVSNALNHSHMQREEESIFYLRDVSGEKQGRIAVARYPERWLGKLIQTNPGSARAHKLLGDVYLRRLPSPDVASQSSSGLYAAPVLQEAVRSNYERAIQLGCRDAAVNRWLGEYYYRRKRPDESHHFFLMNVGKGSDDPVSCAFLAGLSYDGKKYAKAYNYAKQALAAGNRLNSEQRYQTLRIAALALKQLDEADRFCGYIDRCIQLFPDRQEAYIDLIAYYTGTGRHREARKCFRSMLLNNPYDREGYAVLESYARQADDNSIFADTILEELMVRFEMLDQVIANVYLSRSHILHHKGFIDKARRFRDISQSYTRRLNSAAVPAMPLQSNNSTETDEGE